MRTFKFRAFDTNRKEMTYFSNLFVGVTEGDWHPAIIGQDMGHWTWDYVDEGDYHIMQGTGLKDMDGNEIYEGDILYYRGESKVSICEEFYQVKHGQYCNELSYEDYIGGYGWYGDPIKLFINDELSDFFSINDLIPGNELELGKVVGNVFENPELLKED